VRENRAHAERPRHRWLIGIASRSHACSTRRDTAIAGEIAAPGLAIYGATKAAVIHFTRSVKAEPEGDGG
jgi:NAD(P)-dependent dehydrogenase (short-subunit alcohol dehydrogenase family)